MLNFNHLELMTKKQAHLLYDVSFHFPDTGLIGIHAVEEELLQRFALIFAGMEKPDTGTISYGDVSIEAYKEEELADYRATFMASLFGDFQLRQQLSVFDNIMMGLDYSLQEVEELLWEWQLQYKRDDAIEDISFEDQMKTVLVRTLLRHPHALVFYPDSTPFSRKELSVFYPLLKKLSQRILVIVIGDPACFPLCDRRIELAAGYIVSDTDSYETLSCPLMETKKPFKLDHEIKNMLSHKLNQHFRLKFHMLAILILISFACLSTSIFSTTLNIGDIEMMFLEQNHYSTIAIEKHAKGNDGSIYPSQYEPMNSKDIEVLKKNLKGTITTSYYPQNLGMLISGYSSDAMTHTDRYALIEADGIEDIGAKNLYGRYPQNSYEVALNYTDALQLVDWRELGGSEPEKLLYQTIYWFGHPLMITGILMGESDNNNLNLKMYGYQEQTSESASSLGSRSLYVVKGFHQEHMISSQQTYQKSEKRIIDSLTSLSYNFDDLLPITYSMYYYDGEHKLSQGMYTAIADDLEDGEVILNFSMALQLGYRETYLKDYQNANVSEVERIQSFESFADHWINKEIQLQTYSVAGDASNSTIMKKTVRVKGFLYPFSWEYMDMYDQDLGDIYIRKDTIKDQLQPNVMIEETYFHTDNKEDMEKALTYLLDHERYSAFFSTSRLLQFFVVDLKNMSLLLAAGGGISLLVSLLLLVRYLRKAIHQLMKEMSVYFLFGETLRNIKKFYIRYFSGVLTRRVLFGGFCGTMILAGFILMIFFKISMYTAILYNLLLPLVLVLLFLMIITGFLFLYLHRASVIDEDILRDKR